MKQNRHNIIALCCFTVAIVVALLYITGTVKATSANFIIQASSGGETVDSIRYVHYSANVPDDSGLILPANNSVGGDSLYWQDTVTVDDLIHSMVIWRWYYHGQDMTTEIFNYAARYDVRIDTLFAWADAGIGVQSKTDYASDADSIAVMLNATDTIGYKILHHPSGTAGDPPDSTKNITGP